MRSLLIDWRAARRGVVARWPASAGLVMLVGTLAALSTFVYALAGPSVLVALPYESPEELAVITVVQPPSNPADIPTLNAWREQKDLIRQIAAYQGQGDLRVRLSEGAAILKVAAITTGFFQTLGRCGECDAILAHSGEDASPPLLVTAHAFQRWFGGREDLIGQTFSRTDGRKVRLAGVLPVDFVFPSNRVMAQFDAVMPLAAGQAGTKGDVPVSGLTVLARRQPGASVDHVISSLGAGSDLELRGRTLENYLGASSRSFMTLAVLGMVMLVAAATANSINLHVAMLGSRRAELQTRRALGSGSRDLATLLAFEGLILLATGGLLGLVGGAMLIGSMGQLLPAEYSILGEPTLTLSSAAVGLGVGVLMFGVSIATAFSLEQMAGKGGGMGWRNSRIGLVTLQTVCAVALLAGCLTLSRSYANLVSQDAGFNERSQILTVSYPDTTVGFRLQQTIEQSLDAVRVVPGIHKAGAIIGPMLNRTILFGALIVDGQPVEATPKSVTTDYFEASGMTVIAGRPLVASDRARSVVLSEQLANRLWPPGTALGRRVGRNGQLEVVGVVRDTLDSSLDRPPIPTVFSLVDNPGGCAGNCNTVSYVLAGDNRTKVPVSAAVRALIPIDRDAVIADASSVADRLSDSVRTRTFAAVVLGLFAMTAALVCATGILSIVRFGLDRRRREIATRMALGATPTNIMLLVTREMLLAVVLGLTGGSILASTQAAALDHLVFGVGALDLPSLIAAVLGTAGFGAFAAWLPARAAARQPVAPALRAE